jgi:hypothetical protein
VSAEGIVTFAGDHGCYQFIGDDKDAPAEYVVNNITGKKVSMKQGDLKGISMPVGQKVERNWDEWHASITVLKKKIPLYTLFDGMVKKTPEQWSQDAELFQSIFNKKYDDAQLEVDPLMADASKRRRKAPAEPPKAPAVL